MTEHVEPVAYQRLILGGEFGSITEQAGRVAASLYKWSRGSADPEVLRHADAWSELAKKNPMTVGDVRRLWMHARRRMSPDDEWSPSEDYGDDDITRTDVFLAYLGDAEAATRCSLSAHALDSSHTVKRADAFVASRAWRTLAELFRELDIGLPADDEPVDDALLFKHRTLLSQFCEMFAESEQ